MPAIDRIASCARASLAPSDAPPDPRDAAFVALANACGYFDESKRVEMRPKTRRRLQLLCQLDVIVRRVTEAARRAAVLLAAEIPAPRGLPVLGNALQLSGDINEFMTNRYRELGPVFRVQAFGQNSIVLAGTEANQFLHRKSRSLLRSAEVWSDFEAAMDSSNSLVGLDGPEHFKMRRVMRDSFARAAFEQSIPTALAFARSETSKLAMGESAQGFRLLQHILTSQVCLLTIGRSAGDHHNELVEYLTTVFGVHMMRSKPAVALRTPRMRRIRRQAEELCAEVLVAHERERRIGEAPDLVDQILEARGEHPQLFPETNLFLLTLSPFFVAADTASATAAFLLYELLKNPELCARARSEADAIMREGDPTPAKLAAADVLPRVFMESLRRYPIVAVLQRVVANSFDFGGYQIPAGARLMAAISVPHFLEEIYPDPLRFDIDRFLPERSEHLAPGAYMPFGIGPHRCLGSNFAEAQVTATIALILHEFDLELDPPNYKLNIHRLPTPRPANDFKVRILGRRAAAS